jgi:hypothetical protein
LAAIFMVTSWLLPAIAIHTPILLQEEYVLERIPTDDAPPL